MAEEVACVADSLAEARSAARALAPRVSKDRLLPYARTRYLATTDAPARVIVCALGRSPEDQLRRLRRLRDRLLWPAASADFQDAIGGLRTGGRPRRTGSSRPEPAEEIAAALLLEGPIDSARARACLLAGGPLEWIAESVRHVRIGDADLARLGRAGVRWSVLEPVEVVGVCVSPALAAARIRWRRMFPEGTPVWA